MNCDDVKNGIYVYLDGEFAAPEAAEFTRHLDSCGECRQHVEREAGFLTSLKDQLSQTPGLPEGVRQRIERAIDGGGPIGVGEDERPRGLARLMPQTGLGRAAALTAPIALAALLLFTIGPPAGGPGTMEEPTLTHAVAEHEAPKPMEVSGSQETVRRFLQDNVPFAVSVPFTDDPDLELVGARLTKVDGRAAVLFQYDMDGKRLSVLQAALPVAAAISTPLTPAAATPAPDFRVGSRQGYGVMTFGHRGVTNAVVSDLPEGRLRGLVHASYRQ